MNNYKGIIEFEERLKEKNVGEFAREYGIAEELFNLFIEGMEINKENWHLQPEKKATMGLVNRIFNDLHCSFKLLMEGLFVQGMSLLRDTIECTMYIKLFEVDSAFRREWLNGKDFLTREIRGMMKKSQIPPPPEDQLYKQLCRTYVHPTFKGIAPHVCDWYTPDGKQYFVCHYGGIEDVPRAKILFSAFLLFSYGTTSHLWRDMFPVDKNKYSEWHDKMDNVLKRLYPIQEEADKSWFNTLIEQLTTIQKVLNNRFVTLDEEAEEISDIESPFDDEETG